jgi:hypothetical protein
MGEHENVSIALAINLLFAIAVVVEIQSTHGEGRRLTYRPSRN